MTYDSDEPNAPHKYKVQGGTSVSSPLTAGAFAGLWSQFPAENNVTIRQRMTATATNVEPYNANIFTGTSGRGLVNMLDAYRIDPSNLFSFKIESINILNDDNYDGRITPG
ncbi:MAG: S8 family serine peptidase, partial [Aliifodinibius sp.]|nr:S8 family serine peptidase [Fodinibius sp.]